MRYYEIRCFHSGKKLVSPVSRHINTTRLIRTYNASAVLQTLYRNGSCSRTQLSQLTGMSPATITRITAELIEQGIVLEGQAGTSTGGRRPIYLHIDHSKLYIASLKLLRDDCQAALLDLKGKIIHKTQLDWNNQGPEELLHTAVGVFQAMFAAMGVNPEHILGLGVAISGICQPKDGIVIRSVNLDWENISVAEFLSSRLRLPVFIENDANACALAELWLGTAKDSTNSMYLKTEEGAGAGIIVGKTLVNGPRFTTGEVGHVSLIPNGRPCRCGQRGCLETYVYFGDVQARYAEATGKLVDRNEFVRLVHTGDQVASQLTREAAEALALACAHWGILLDLDVITIGGFWGTLKKEIIDHCRNYYKTISEQSGIPCNVIITGASFDEEADLLGAAGLVIDRWFAPLSVPFHR